MLGYWNMKKETTDVIRNGWLHTGDIGEITEDGNLKTRRSVSFPFFYPVLTQELDQT